MWQIYSNSLCFYLDHSRDNSPLHDVVLQSAPGSPRGSYHNHRDSHALQDIELQSAPSSPSSSTVHPYNVLHEVIQSNSNSSPSGYREDQKLIIDSVTQSRAPIPAWRPNYDASTGWVSNCEFLSVKKWESNFWIPCISSNKQITIITSGVRTSPIIKRPHDDDNDFTDEQDMEDDDAGEFDSPVKRLKFNWISFSGRGQFWLDHSFDYTKKKQIFFSTENCSFCRCLRWNKKRKTTTERLQSFGVFVKVIQKKETQLQYKLKHFVCLNFVNLSKRKK